MLDAIEKPSLFKEWIKNKPSNLNWYHFSMKEHEEVKCDSNVIYVICDKYMIPHFQYVDLIPKNAIIKWNRKESINWATALSEGYTIQKFQRNQEE